MVKKVPPDLTGEEKRALLTETPVEAAQAQVRDLQVNEGSESAVKTAREKMYEVCGSLDPRPLREIGETGTAVLTDAILGLFLGMVPMLGFLVLAYLVWKYFVRKWHIQTGSIPGPLLVLIRCWNIYVVLASPVSLGLAYKRWHQAHEQDAHSAQSACAFEKLRLQLFYCISTIASVLLTRILVVHAADVKAQIAYYNAIAKSSMDADASYILDRLEHLLKDLLLGDTSSTRWALLGVSMCLFVGFAELARQSLEGGTLVAKVYELCHRGFLLYGITVGFYRLMYRLTAAPDQMQAKAEQLLLFRTVTSHENYVEWPYEHKKILRDILRRHQEQRAKQECLEEQPCRTAGETVPAGDDKPVAECTDAELGTRACDLILGVASKATPLDLTRWKDLKTWWRVRQGLVLSFTDESCIADSALAIAAVIIGCFLALAFAEWTAYIVPALGTHSSWGFPDRATDNDLWPLIVATALACVIMITLVSLLLILMNQCVYINTLWSADHSMLLDAAINLEMKDLESPEGHSLAARTSRLIQSIQQRIEDDDRRQRLFGIVINDRVIRGVVFTLACALLRVLWDRLHRWLHHPDRVANSWNYTQVAFQNFTATFVNEGWPH